MSNVPFLILCVADPSHKNKQMVIINTKFIIIFISNIIVIVVFIIENVLMHFTHVQCRARYIRRTTHNPPIFMGFCFEFIKRINLKEKSKIESY